MPTRARVSVADQAIQTLLLCPNDVPLMSVGERQHSARPEAVEVLLVYRGYPGNPRFYRSASEGRDNGSATEARGRLSQTPLARNPTSAASPPPTITCVLQADGRGSRRTAGPAG